MDLRIYSFKFVHLWIFFLHLHLFQFIWLYLWKNQLWQRNLSYDLRSEKQSAQFLCLFFQHTLSWCFLCSNSYFKELFCFVLTFLTRCFSAYFIGSLCFLAMFMNKRYILKKAFVETRSWSLVIIHFSLLLKRS